MILSMLANLSYLVLVIFNLSSMNESMYYTNLNERINVF